LKKVAQAGKGELVFAGSLFLVSLIVFWDTHRLILPTNNTVVSPRTFPYAVATLLALAAIGVIFEVLRGNVAVPEGADPKSPFERADYRTMFVIVAAIGLHVFLLERTGYIISATISFWGVAYAFGAKRMLKLAFTALIFSGYVYFAFKRMLGIQLPQGLFETILNSVRF